VWEDGSAFDFTNWEDNQTIVIKQSPTNDDSGEKCVAVKNLDLRWKTTICTGYTQRNFFICQTKKLLNTSSTLVSMPFVSPTNISKVLSKSSSEGPSGGKQAGILIGIIVMIAFLR
jgi:hypothetical protein